MPTRLFFSPLSLLYLPLFWGLWPIWNWALCSMINTNIFAFFFMQISCLTSTICWRYLFFQCIFSALCQNTGVHVCVDLGLIQLKYTLLFNKPHPQNDHCNESLVWLKVSSKPSSLDPHWNSSWISCCCLESRRSYSYHCMEPVPSQAQAGHRWGRCYTQDVVLSGNWNRWSEPLGPFSQVSDRASSLRPMPLWPTLLSAGASFSWRGRAGPAPLLQCSARGRTSYPEASKGQSQLRITIEY